VVLPLVRRSSLDSSALLAASVLNPVFTVEGVEVLLHSLEIVSIATD